MTQAPRLHRYTFNDYLTMEVSSTVRHEFLAGEIYAMAGGTPQHAALAAAMTAALISATRGGACRVHSSDLRIRVTETGLATYPDVTVVCGPYQSDPEDKNTIVNPRVVVEVTSESTEHYDRAEKLASYQSIRTMSAIVLVSHRERLIEVYERQPDDSWKRAEARRQGRITSTRARLRARHRRDLRHGERGVAASRKAASTSRHAERRYEPSRRTALRILKSAHRINPSGERLSRQLTTFSSATARGMISCVPPPATMTPVLLERGATVMGWSLAGSVQTSSVPLV